MSEVPEIARIEQGASCETATPEEFFSLSRQAILLMCEIARRESEIDDLVHHKLTAWVLRGECADLTDDILGDLRRKFWHHEALQRHRAGTLGSAAMTSVEYNIAQ